MTEQQDRVDGDDIGFLTLEAADGDTIWIRPDAIIAFHTSEMRNGTLIHLESRTTFVINLRPEEVAREIEESERVQAEVMRRQFRLRNKGAK